MASHTPKRLEIQALEAFVILVLQNSTPPFMKKLKIHQSSSMTEPVGLDEILMSRDNSSLQLRDKRKIMLEHLMKLKHWWENNEWLGNQNMEVRRLIKECFTTELELIDPECAFPLFRFLLQLIFSTKAGCAADSSEFPDHPKIVLELARNDCHLYCDILSSLTPFGIEELSTGHIIFGKSEPWLIIIKNSPLLKKVHFRNNICEEILINVGLFCNMIDTFIVEQLFGRLMVSMDCFYKTFFSGMDYKTISTILKGQCTPYNIKLSFPRLKYVDVGWKGQPGNTTAKYSLTEFMYNLLYFYPDIISTSCHSLRPFVLTIPSHLPEHCRSLKYNIKHVDFDGVTAWIQHQFPRHTDVSISQCYIDEIISPLKAAHHVTFGHCVSTQIDNESVKEQIQIAEAWFPRFKFTSWTLYIPYTPPEDIREGSFISLYTSLFEKNGKNISALHIHLNVEVDVKELSQILIFFPCLELLELRIQVGIHSGDDGEVSVKTLQNLKSLSVTYAAHTCAMLINTFIEKIIQASPSLKSLELVLEHAPLEWLMTLAIKKLLSGIQMLRLSFTALPLFTRQRPHTSGRDVEASFYVPLIELLPNLETFMLGLVPIDVFKQVRMIYSTSQLKVQVRGTPYIGYAILDS